MRTSDAIVVGEDWISEHYFTTEVGKQSFQAKVQERRKQWDDAGTDTVRSRFIGARRGLESMLADLMSGEGAGNGGAAASELYAQARRVLGYTAPDFGLTRVGPVIRVSAPGITEAAPLVIVEALPVDALDDLLAKDADTLLCGYPVDEKTTLTSVARLLSTLFVDPAGPDFALVFAGRWALVAEKERWPEGRYLAIDLQLVSERNGASRGGEIDRALTCLSAESLAPDADGTIWWSEVLAESIKHTVGVSADLREGVRASIEIIANEVVDRRRARSLEALPQTQAQPLAKQALRFLYRILFLLYAEASPELGVLPVGATEYEQGYGLDRLRELTLTELATPKARAGTHLYESLATLFRLVDQGHAAVSTDEDDVPEGLTFSGLKADLFHPAATALIDEVGLGNAAVQKVLRRLLLSKEAKGRDRGFISYAELGINQLGAVYEGLMSYTGFFAETDLYEVAKSGDATKGSWVVPVEPADGIAETDFVREVDEVTGESKAVLHQRGTFVFRLAGRERQQSASYYTPEVLTRFTVSQALAELLDQDGHTTTAEQILGLSVCEPALGSGAFAIEAVRQLAEQYLKRRQDELGEKIDPDAYPLELQRVKASIALHQVHGVDLNATAVELAEISLWLDTMVAGLEAPWFGLHLRRGNSLIGARHAVYSRAQVNDKSWLRTPPGDVPLAAPDAEAVDALGGRVHHFLLPAAGWGSAVESREATGLAPDAAKALKTWRSRITAKPSTKQLNALAELSSRVGALWALTLRRLQVAETEARRHIPLWGRDEPDRTPAVLRDQIERTLNDPKGAYQRLRRVMDAWCALWFWPLTDTGGVTPPDLDAWIAACQGLLGRDFDFRKRNQAQQALGAAADWAELDAAEDLDLGFAQASAVAKVVAEHPWLGVCERVAAQQGFFHWQLDFAPAFARGGFDLQLGNPPWVRPTASLLPLLAESDPWWGVSELPKQSPQHERKSQTLALPGVAEFVLSSLGEATANISFLVSVVNYELFGPLSLDLYHCFVVQCWKHSSIRGNTGLLHPEGIFSDDKGGTFRRHVYSRLRRHWAFRNQLKLFEEVGNTRQYGVAIYGSEQAPRFLNAVELFHPDTAERSLRHDGSGEEPGFGRFGGGWDLRPHARRVQVVDQGVIDFWNLVLNSSATSTWGRMVNEPNSTTSALLRASLAWPKMRDRHWLLSKGWMETASRNSGLIAKVWGIPAGDEVVLQGAQIEGHNAYFQQPNPAMANHRDYSSVDLEGLQEFTIPVTSYKRACDRSRYLGSYDRWGDVSALSTYRIAWREMVDTEGERTMRPALIPPGYAHVDMMLSAWTADPVDLVIAQGFAGSLLADYLVRRAGKGHVNAAAFEGLPLVLGSPLRSEILLRVLRLNALTASYAELWQLLHESAFASDSWTDGYPRDNQRPLGEIGPEWTGSTPLRIAEDRRQALVELDALVALMLGVTADQLCTVYRTQFAVLYGYDHNTYLYDANGRLVPNSVQVSWRKKGDATSVEERTATKPGPHPGAPDTTYTYELPFRFLDREADMRAAYAEFERRLEERAPVTRQEGNT